MKHCTNADCPHFVRVGSPAEYVADVAVCGDCGEALSEGPAPERPAVPAVPPALWRRLAVTLLALPVLFMLPWLTLPGIDAGALRESLRGQGLLDGLYQVAGSLRPPASVGVFSLGIMPLVSAAVVVELAACAVPRWRPLRSSPAGRGRLLRATLVFTFLLVAFQSFGVTKLFESMPQVYKGSAPVVVLSLMAGTALLILGAGVLGRRGLVNGFSWMLAFSAGSDVIARVARQLDHAPDHPVTPFDAVLVLGVPAGIVLATLRVLGAHRRAEAPERRAARKDYREHPLSGLTPIVRLPASGIAPLLLGAWLMTLPALLSQVGVPGTRALASLLWTNSVLHDVLYVGLAAGSAVLFAYAFHMPDAVAGRWVHEARRREDREQIHALLRDRVRSAALLSAAFVGGLGLAEVAGTRWLGSPVAVVSIVTLTAVLADLAAEWRARRAAGGELLAVWSEHDIDTADMLARALDVAGIPAHPRGASHRTLLQIFGPYVPIDILVPPERVGEAKRALAPLVGDGLLGPPQGGRARPVRPRPRPRR